MNSATWRVAINSFKKRLFSSNKSTRPAVTAEKGSIAASAQSVLTKSIKHDAKESIFPRILPQPIIAPRQPDVVVDSVVTEKIRNLDGMTVQDMGTKRIINLNRPKALNSLTVPMLKQLRCLADKSHPDSKDMNMIILKSSGGAAFCAGGDLKGILDSNKTGTSYGHDFLREQCRMEYLLGSKRAIPIVALMDGLAMGLGVGISVHGPFRVATERTIVSMPEIGLGFFPDVGASYFIPRLRGQLGLFLVLTGYRLRGWDCLEAGIATHYIASQYLTNAEAELMAIPGNSVSKENISLILNKYQKLSTNVSQQQFSLQPYLGKIDEIFSENTVEGIMKRLQQDGSGWALKQIAIMKKMAPMSMKVTMREMSDGAKLNFKDCIKMEYRLAERMYEAHHDTSEGIRAVLIDKDNAPKWKPATLEEITEEMLQWYFEPLPTDKKLVLEDLE